MKDSQTQQNIQTSAQEQKFYRFKQWFKQNGGLQRNINFPVRFNPGNYLGISAKQQIKPNTVILAVPKKIVVSLSIAKQSQLKQIIKTYQVLSNQQDDDCDYNILCLFLIMQKMKGQKSFFYPYIQLLDSSQTVMNWSNQQIQSLKDPYINLQFINSVRSTFEPVYKTFIQITQKHKDLFPLDFTRQMFDQIYAAVMTRGFGWGLPETMMVPYADFLNHSSTGVHHYVFDKCLENKKASEIYIQKKYELDLKIFPDINNQSLLPIDYERNTRQNYIFYHKQKLKELNLSFNNDSVRLDPHITNPLYNLLIATVIEQNFQDEICLSTDSQDNDSASDDDEEQQDIKKSIKTNQSAQNLAKQQIRSNKIGTILMQKNYLKYVYKQVQKDLDKDFTQPKPNVNAQFEDGVKFDWWFQNHDMKNQKQQFQDSETTKQENNNLQTYCDSHIQNKQLQKDQDKFFIVASAKKIYPNQQIYNCYGRRSNRFLLIWYGFCFQNNKYDSVPFRIWSQQITRKTGQSIYTEFLTQKQYKQGIPIGNQRYNAYMLSQEFRLKKKRINYKLLAFLRYRFLKSHRIYLEHYKTKQIHVNKITSIEMEIQCFLQYQRLLNELVQIFDIGISDQKTQDNNKFNQKRILNPARQYFNSILEKSNQQILIKNVLAVNQMLKILVCIQNSLKDQQNKNNDIQGKNVEISDNNKIKWGKIPKKVMQQLYIGSFKQIRDEREYLLQRLINISGQQSQQLIKSLKIMVRQYFRMLFQSVICNTLEIQFN